MPKLKFLDPTQALTVTQNGFSNLLRDIHRNDPVAKILGYVTPASMESISNMNVGSGETLDDMISNAVIIQTASNLIGVTQIASLTAETNDVLALSYVKVGSGFKIGRVPGETDSTLLAETAYGVPGRTTFPSIQAFAEKTLPNQELRDLLETSEGAWTPTGNLVGIAIKQSTQEIFCIFSATAQDSVVEFLAVVDLDDISDIHFGE